MLDAKLLRESPDLVRAAIAKKHLAVDLDAVVQQGPQPPQAGPAPPVAEQVVAGGRVDGVDGDVERRQEILIAYAEGDTAKGRVAAGPGDDGQRQHRLLHD